MTRIRAERLNQNSTVAVIKPKQRHYEEVELRGIAESGVNCLLFANMSNTIHIQIVM